MIYSIYPILLNEDVILSVVEGSHNAETCVFLPGRNDI